MLPHAGSWGVPVAVSLRMSDGVRWLSRGMHEVPAATGWLSRAEAARLESLRFAKRRTEVRLARWTAKHAIAHVLGLDTGHPTLAAIEVRPQPTGAPYAVVGEARAPLSVSMTDRADWAVCVVAPPEVGVGCDLELVEPRSEGFVRDWFTPAERDLMAATPSGERWDMLANLVWSAKESALKVLQTGLRRDTRSVEVDLLDRDGDGQWARLVVVAEEGNTFPGWWRRYGEFVLTVAADAELGPPLGIEEPPRLAAATPSHGWLDQLG
jgi:4'-phosphopantetheinyl transferase